MDKKIGILHLSDAHISKENKSTIDRLIALLQKDITLIQKEMYVDIKMVCVSGDLINSGDNADAELDIALGSFLQPLMEMLGLREDSIFLVPGNHEVKRNSIVNYIENGLASTLITENNIDEFLSSIDDHSLERILYFDRDFARLFGGNPVWESSLTRAYMVNTGTLTIGVSCVNSAWRSTGIGSGEKRKMIVGRKQIVDSFEKIKNADIKLCVLHHPFDWLVDDDKIAIEKCINQFDIVLNGHIHESETKTYTSFNGQTLFNTCGKFDATSDIYNGYSIIAINPYNKNCDVILRQYMDFPRNCFDAALCVAGNGVFTTSLGNKDNNLALAYNISHSIESKFLDYANSYFVSNVAAGKVLKSFDESFIIPEFNRYSEYEKETLIDTEEKSEQPDEVTLEELCGERKNILLLGRKEIGKTTVLHYLAKYCLCNFNVLKSVPIIINTLYIDYSGKKVITRAIHKFINQYCESDDSFSIKDVENILHDGLCTIMFDNFETVGPAQLDKINAFLKEYPSNRFIFAEKENISSRYMRDVHIVPECDYETIHICSLSKHQIRSIASQNFSSGDSSNVVDKILLCFKKTTLPRTPFVLSLILSLCDTADFTPINEAVIMEQFMEFLLEKSSPSEAYSTTYDFRIKEDFLMQLVTYMHDQNKFYMSILEFESVLSKYHAEKGFSVSDTKFDRLFFEKGVLVRTELVVTFRYNCMIEYYLAKKAQLSPEFLSQIMSDRNYLNYTNELLYFTGLNRQNKEIVSVLQEALSQDFDKLRSVVPSLDEYNIGLDISLPEEKFSEKIKQTKLSQEQSDRIQNTKDTSETKTPEEMDKQVEHEEMDAFIQTLLVYGNCLKNLELLSKKEKEEMYNYYIYGLCIMLGIFKRTTEEYFNSEISDMEQLPEKYTPEDLNKVKALMEDVLKISLPLALENIALENIGTTKLKSIIERGFEDGSRDEFSRFFSVFLYCDLRLPGLQNVLKSYCTDAKDKSLLKIIFFKLLYYYRFRYFSSSLDPFFDNILADINIKLNGGNKLRKGVIIQELKKQKKFLNA